MRVPPSSQVTCAYSQAACASCQTPVMRDEDGLAIVALVLGAAGDLVQRVHEGVVARGFTDLRPAHGFAFVRISHGGATASELADHLGMTRQAASQLVDELENKG